MSNLSTREFLAHVSPTGTTTQMWRGTERRARTTRRTSSAPAPNGMSGCAAR